MVVLAVLALGMGAGVAAAVTPGEVEPTTPTVVLFHGEGCPHCAAEREFLAELAVEHPEVLIQQYEVWHDEANQQLLAQYEDRLGFEAAGVPVTIVGDRVWVGFSAGIGAEIEQAVTAASAGASTTPAKTTPNVVVPLLGEVSLQSTSLVVSTLVIGFVDGINPCSLWVLSVLLALVLHSGSRGRVMLVGATFLMVTAAMYGLYILGFYSALDYLGELTWIRVVVAGVAMTFGLLQLKDGLVPGRGPSLSISPERRPGLYRRMREVSRVDRGVPAVLGATVVLAVGVSLLETPCTAGLPLLWTSLVTDAGVSTATAVALFALYLGVFLLDELLLFAAAVVTLRATRLQQHHGQALKIVAGSVLVTLAAVMLVAPAALTTVGGTVVVFCGAGVVALLLWLVARNLSRGRAAPTQPR